MHVWCAAAPRDVFGLGAPEEGEGGGGVGGGAWLALFQRFQNEPISCSLIKAA